MWTVLNCLDLLHHSQTVGKAEEHSMGDTQVDMSAPTGERLSHWYGDNMFCGAFESVSFRFEFYGPLAVFSKLFPISYLNADSEKNKR